MTIFQELLIAAQTVEPLQQKQESDAEFLKRLVQMISRVDDKTWDGLSVNAQTWYNSAATADISMKPYPPCPGFKGNANVNVAVAPVPQLSKIERRHRNRRKGVLDAIREAVITHQGFTARQIYDLLHKDWPNVNFGTISVNVGDINRMIYLAKQLGYWNDKPEKKEQEKDKEDVSA